MGMLNRRVPSWSAFVSMIIGLILLISTLIAYPVFAPKKLNAATGNMEASSFADFTGFSNFHLMGIVFLLLVGIMFVASKVSPRAEAWVLETRTPIDMTPWKNAKWASLLLVILVFAIYAAFAK
jgi:SSS family solute:Na+ symporter